MAQFTLQQVSKILGSKAVSKIHPASFVASEGIKAGKQISNEIFGYDFVGLMIKLFIFYSIAFVFAKFMEAVIFLRGGFKIIANTLGFNIPNADQLPQSLKDLFGDTGLKGFRFWDIIKIISILLVTAEFFRYVNTNKKLGAKSSPMTIGIFTLIILTLGIATIPELIKRFKTTDFNLEAFK